MIEFVLIIYIAGSNFLPQGIYPTLEQCQAAADAWRQNLPGLVIECRGRRKDPQ